MYEEIHPLRWFKCDKISTNHSPGKRKILTIIFFKTPSDQLVKEISPRELGISPSEIWLVRSSLIRNFFSIEINSVSSEEVAHHVIRRALKCASESG